MYAPERGKAQDGENRGKRELLTITGDKDQSDKKPTEDRAEKRAAPAGLTLAEFGPNDFEQTASCAKHVSLPLWPEARQNT